MIEDTPVVTSTQSFTLEEAIELGMFEETALDIEDIDLDS